MSISQEINTINCCFLNYAFWNGVLSITDETVWIIETKEDVEPDSTKKQVSQNKNTKRLDTIWPCRVSITFAKGKLADKNLPRIVYKLVWTTPRHLVAAY